MAALSAAKNRKHIFITCLKDIPMKGRLPVLCRGENILPVGNLGSWILLKPFQAFAWGFWNSFALIFDY
jgi:hypothetical protein